MTLMALTFRCDQVGCGQCEDCDPHHETPVGSNLLAFNAPAREQRG
jgi:hypothetical protein